MKKTILALLAVIVLISVSSCSGGAQDWNGTFYNYLDENHILVITFEQSDSDDYLIGSETELWTGNGISRSRVSIGAELTKKNMAESNRGYRYTLKGDTLTVKYVDDDEIFGTDFSGIYTRGASIEETFDVEEYDDSLTAEQIERYEELSLTHMHYSNDDLISIPKGELEYSPIDGIDYSSADIRDAFANLYDTADSTIINNRNTVYDGSDNSPDVSKGDTPANPASPRPAVYMGGVNIGQEGRGDLFEVEALDGDDLWLGLGDLVSDYIEELGYPDDGYGEWNDPDFWGHFADYIIERLKEELINSNNLVDSDTLAFIVNDALTTYADEAWGDDIYWDGLGDVIDDYINEWSDPGDEYYNPGYDMNEISYKTRGRQFYREALSARQQKAYDVLATAVQRGNFHILYYDFGIRPDEAEMVIRAMVLDNPEFMFICGQSWGPVDAETVTTIEVLLDDDIMRIGIDEALRDIADRSRPIIAAANQLSSDIDKVKYIVDYMCAANEYPEDPSTCKYSYSMYSAIVANEAICAGYASAFHYYMNALGIEATRVSSCGHQWNLILLDGDYYYMDVTWIDSPHYVLIDGKQTLIDISYDWFNFNEAVADTFGKKTDSNSHARDYLAVLLPKANGTKYSYANWYGDEDLPTPFSDPGDKQGDQSDPSDEPDNWSDPGYDPDDWSDPGDEPDDWSDPGDELGNSSTLGDWDIPELWESSELIEDWQEGPTSLWEPMTENEVSEGITGTYVGYYKFTSNQIVFTFNEDNLTGYWEETDSGWPATPFEFNFVMDVDHPMLDNTYNGMIFVDCEDGTTNEFVVVSPSIIYEPQYEAIFYKVN